MGNREALTLGVFALVVGDIVLAGIVLIFKLTGVV